MDQKAQAPNASHATDAPPKPVLDYPFEAPPQRGQTLEVAPGVLWIRMPLPYALDHINLWPSMTARAGPSSTPVRAPTKAWPPGARCSPNPPTAAR